MHHTYMNYIICLQNVSFEMRQSVFSIIARDYTVAASPVPKLYIVSVFLL